MANYSNSTLVDAIGILSDRYQRHEFRKEKFGGHELYLSGVDYTIPELSDIRKSTNRTTTAKYLKKSSPSIANTRSCDPSGTVGDSGTVDLSWTTYATTITVSEKRHGNNYFSKVQALSRELESAFMALHEDIEDDLVAHLEANKTDSMTAASFLGSFDSSNDIFEVTNANKDRYFNYLSTVMKENKYYGPYMAVQNMAAGAIMAEQTAQGPGNDENLQYQYGDLTSMMSHSVTLSSDYMILSYVAEPDSVAVLDWIEPLNRQGAVAGEREWTTMGDLFGYPWTWQVLYKKTCADTSNSGGAVQDLTEVWEISIDLATAKAPLSSGEAIYKFGLLSS